MKILITILFILISCFSKAQGVAERYMTNGKDTFTIEYHYNPHLYFDPEKGRSHIVLDSKVVRYKKLRDNRFYYHYYLTTITVYRFAGKRKELIARDMPGFYVPAKCIEDDPTNWIKKAFAIKNKKN